MAICALVMADLNNLTLTIHQLLGEVSIRLLMQINQCDNLVIWQEYVVEPRPLDSRCESTEILGARILEPQTVYLD